MGSGMGLGMGRYGQGWSGAARQPETTVAMRTSSSRKMIQPTTPEVCRRLSQALRRY